MKTIQKKKTPATDLCFIATAKIYEYGDPRLKRPLTKRAIAASHKMIAEMKTITSDEAASALMLCILSLGKRLEAEGAI